MCLQAGILTVQIKHSLRLDLGVKRVKSVPKLFNFQPYFDGKFTVIDGAHEMLLAFMYIQFAIAVTFTSSFRYIVA